MFLFFRPKINIRNFIRNAFMDVSPPRNISRALDVYGGCQMDLASIYRPVAWIENAIVRLKWSIQNIAN